MEDDKQDEEKEPTGAIVPQEAATVTLTYPIKFGEQTITELTFRPLTAKEMRRTKAKLNSMLAQSTVLDYAGYLSGQPPHVIDLLAGPDAVEVIGVVSGFFVPSHATGTKQ